ncbi:MAG TPA: hypothetical protein VKV15_09155 [Bryobacteraceae bacterium]|nr:hypothetical protein [Bryobacteraceae bacterium]
MTKPAIIGLFIFLAIAGYIVYSTLTATRHRVNVCMTFNGRTECRTAAGTTRDFALRSAVTNACALIASGVTDTVRCEQSQPVSVKWLDR